jgi:hypothetical protein
MISQEQLVRDIKIPDMEQAIWLGKISSQMFGKLKVKGSNVSSYIRCRLSKSTLISNFRNVLDPKNFGKYSKQNSCFVKRKKMDRPKNCLGYIIKAKTSKTTEFFIIKIHPSTNDNNKSYFFLL